MYTNLCFQPYNALKKFDKPKQERLIIPLRHCGEVVLYVRIKYSLYIFNAATPNEHMHEILWRRKSKNHPGPSLPLMFSCFQTKLCLDSGLV